MFLLSCKFKKSNSNKFAGLTFGRVYWRNRRFIKPDYSVDINAEPQSATVNPTPAIFDEHSIPDPAVNQTPARRRRKQHHEGPLRRSSRAPKKNPRYD